MPLTESTVLTLASLGVFGTLPESGMSLLLWLMASSSLTLSCSDFEPLSFLLLLLLRHDAFSC
jgi:hypothetical protein